MDFISMLRRRPQAVARIRGSAEYPGIIGSALFFQKKEGVLVAAEVFGLPAPEEVCGSPTFAFHIHSGGTCTGNAGDPFADALAHYNPQDCPHPYHAGDLPPLFGNNGHALLMVLTDRFTVQEVLGKTVIIHADRDDFTSQPSGDAGKKMACGQIKAFGAC